MLVRASGSGLGGILLRLLAAEELGDALHHHVEHRREDQGISDIIGSLEFGTKLVGSKLVVVLGHTECGAVKGACDGAQLGNLTHTLSNVMPALYSVKGSENRSSSNAAFVQKVADANVRLTVKALTDRSQVMRGLVEEGKLEIVGAMYNIATGRVTFMK